MARVAGIDVAATRPSTAVLVEDGHVARWSALAGPEDLRLWLDELRPTVVAIDAPSGLSKGLLAQPEDGSKPYNGRVCDRELRRRSISLYEVPSTREELDSWMEMGLQLYEACETAGYRIPVEVGQEPSAIEVYPYASFCVLLGGRPEKKTTVRGIDQRFEALRRFGLVWDDRKDHDSLDALAAAATAHAYRGGRATALGDPSEALIWLPATEILPSYIAPASYTGADEEGQKLARAPGPPSDRVPCLCGCGGYPKGKRSRFLPGHDAKYYSGLRKKNVSERNQAGPLKLEELDSLLGTLGTEQRGELLKELLVAAPHGGRAMVAVLNAWLLSAAGEEFLANLSE